jgi:spore maturation protein CgeB
MVDRNTKIGNFFNENEIVLYKNIKDLTKKILLYSKNDKLRKKIAKNGRKKYFKHFNSKIIAEFIINKTFNNNKKYFWEKFL